MASIVSVHPRWRGEHPSNAIDDVGEVGSSPLARGTLNYTRQRRIGRRFIPAGAGNTSCHASKRFCPAVHPRWRGEHFCFVGQADGDFGSSPLARGTLRNGEVTRIKRRFIPAGAGNTERILPVPRQATVHPRWRGEHSTGHSFCIRCGGSSPLARGTPGHTARSACGRRFIPAGAGNTMNTMPSRSISTVHPRWRGEHMGRVGDVLVGAGSSPLARGTLCTS